MDILFACSSPGNCSVWGSHLTGLPSSMATLAMWHIDTLRCAISGGATVSRRYLTQSMKLYQWSFER